MAIKTTRKSANPQSKLGAPQLQAIANLFSVLSEPSRLRILQMLHEGPLNVTDLVTGLGMKQANVSKQLGILYQAGVLARVKEGNQVWYSIRMPLIFDLCSLVCTRLQAEAQQQAQLLGKSR